jgi:hypothetical protein
VMSKICRFPKCGRKVLARGWCASHYRHIYINNEAPKPIRVILPLMPRLWSRVTKTKTCWNWTGAVNNKGYGVIGVGKRGKIAYVHRLVWAAEKGPIPAALEICHRCDNPRCVRIAHMFLGSHATNMHDMAVKGRGNSTVSPTQVRKAIRLRQAGITRKDIVLQTGIKVGTLKDILRGKNWKHITRGRL